jgi:hypothetical protein
MTTWMAWGSPARLSWAGLWLVLVSQPLFVFLILRWFWRLLLWTRFLWRVSRLDLDLVPAHPDRAGGLGILGVTHGAFNWLVAALAVVFSARAAQWILHDGLPPTALQAPIFVFLVIAMLIFEGPLLLFLLPLAEAKRSGLVAYRELADRYTRAFDAKWVRGGAPREEVLGSADIQSLADMGGGYDLVARMRVVPIELNQLAALALSALLPMVPLLATAIPLQQILTKLLGILGR